LRAVSIPERDKSVGDNIGNTKPEGRERIAGYNVLEDHNSDTSSKTTGHGSKTHKQDNTRLPRDTITAVAEAISSQTSLINRVDNEHAKSTEDGRDPVDEGHVHFGAIEIRLGVDGGIDKDEEGDGELERRDWESATVVGDQAGMRTRAPAM
jgi:hypothetical protein